MNHIDLNISTNDRKVHVLLSYYNGKKFIARQVNSLLEQSHGKFEISIRDDASTEPDTEQFLRLIQQQNPWKIDLHFNEKNQGYVKNFMTGLAGLKTAGPNDLFAFSDQDDIWHSNKLERAIDAVEKYNQDEPVLYCSRTEIVRQHDLKKLGNSPKFTKQPSFANALVQSIGGGNTMVFNQAARDLILESAGDGNVVSHDWWAYIIISGAGGHVIYDPHPTIQYIQHEGNLVGTNNGFLAKLTRLQGIVQNRFNSWNDMHVNRLRECEHLLTLENRRIFKLFQAARKGSVFDRIKNTKASGIHRQTIAGNIGLSAAVLLGKM